MKAIVVADKLWGIGKNNDLLFKLPLDMKHFRSQTLGKVIVVGKNTYDSFPNGALPRRVNVVLDSSDKQYSDAVKVSSIDEMLQFVSQYPTDDVFVLGGASVYRQLIDKCDTAIVTKVDCDGGAEVFFPDLDSMPDWTVANIDGPYVDNGMTISFYTYCKTQAND